jgi:hypothetical protein
VEPPQKKQKPPKNTATNGKQVLDNVQCQCINYHNVNARIYFQNQYYLISKVKYPDLFLILIAAVLILEELSQRNEICSPNEGKKDVCRVCKSKKKSSMIRCRKCDHWLNCKCVGITWSDAKKQCSDFCCDICK